MAEKRCERVLHGQRGISATHLNTWRSPLGRSVGLLLCNTDTCRRRGQKRSILGQWTVCGRQQNTEQPSSTWSGWIEVAAIERTKRTTVVNEFIFVPTPHHHRPEVPSTTQLAPLFSQRRRRRWTNKWMNERLRSADCINFQTWLICFYTYLKLSSLLI